jgi:hypothetical protein
MRYAAKGDLFALSELEGWAAAFDRCEAYWQDAERVWLSMTNVTYTKQDRQCKSRGVLRAPA